MCDLGQHRPGLSHSGLWRVSKRCPLVVCPGRWAGVGEEQVSGSRREQCSPEGRRPRPVGAQISLQSSRRSLVIQGPQVDNMRMTENPEKGERKRALPSLPTQSSVRQPHLNLASTSYLLWGLRQATGVLSFVICKVGFNPRRPSANWQSLPAPHTVFYHWCSQVVTGGRSPAVTL